MTAVLSYLQAASAIAFLLLGLVTAGLDLLMPRVSGFDVVEALRSDQRTASIPIMVLTAKVLTDDDKRLLNGQVAAIMQRDSMAGAELVDWLRELVARQRPPAPG